MALNDNRIILPALGLFYCVVYAPFGINETDGGFISGLAWQVLQGKTLYTEVLYVRPPLPVWGHAAYLWVMPDAWEVLGERWLFYLKVMLYTWWGAGVLGAGRARVQWTALAFVVSVHHYPAAAWHTVDGIFFAAGGLGLFFNGKNRLAWVCAGACIAASALCKQSFYPLVPLFVVLVLYWRDSRSAWAMGGLLLFLAMMLGILGLQGALWAFFELSRASAGAGEALQHGVWDYFRIHPLVLAGSVVLLGLAQWRNDGWWRWLFPAFLCTTFAAQVYLLQDYAVPQAQTRVLFGLSAVGILAVYWKKRQIDEDMLRHAALLAVAWCSAISWGYALPVLFAVPLLWNVEFGKRHAELSIPNGRFGLVLVGLMGLFGYAYQFVYRDGLRREMHAHLGEVFPKLNGIYSSAETLALYRDLAELNRQYGPNCTVLPAFPQANYLCGTYPPLPLDWEVRRETGGQDVYLAETAYKGNPVFLVEKSYGDRLITDPEFAFTRHIIEECRRVSETPHFIVYQR